MSMMRALFLAGAVATVAACGNDVPAIAPEERVSLTRDDITRLPPTPTLAVTVNQSVEISTPTTCLMYVLGGREAASCVDQQTGTPLFQVAAAPADKPVYEARRPIYARKTDWEKLHMGK